MRLQSSTWQLRFVQPQGVPVPVLGIADPYPQSHMTSAWWSHCSTWLVVDPNALRSSRSAPLRLAHLVGGQHLDLRPGGRQHVLSQGLSHLRACPCTNRLRTQRHVRHAQPVANTPRIHVT